MFYPKSLHADYLLVSYPKSGRTWLRNIMAKYYHYKYGADENIYIHNIQHPKVPKIMFNHMIDTLEEFKKKSYLKPFSPFITYIFFFVVKIMFRFSYNKKTISFLIRDPRDTIVSYFNRNANRNKIYHKDISHFIRDNIFGINTMIRYYNYIRNFHTKHNNKLITYENMKKDTFGIVADVLGYFGEKNVDEKLLKKAIDQCSFDRMKKKELQTAKDKKLDNNSLHIRKGKVGGYKEELSTQDIDYLNKQIHKNLKIPFYK